jgi:hypothetical protein
MVVQIPFDGGRGIVRGDQFPYTYVVTGIKAGLSATSARLTVKDDLSVVDGSATFKKAITTTDVPTEGHIEDDGSTSGVVVLRFDITTANTEAMTANKIYQYDVQLVLSDGRILTVVRGPAAAVEQVTKTNP